TSGASWFTSEGTPRSATLPSSNLTTITAPDASMGLT
ncbi:hypothetical protein PC129_g18176, partial [Phytophthora cactorum]